MEKHVIDDLSRTLASGASRRQLLRLLGGGIAVGAVSATGLGAAAKSKHGKGKQTHAAQATDPTNIPITGTIAGVSQFVGSFSIDRFAVQNGGVVALGTLSGTLTNLLDNTTQQVNQQIALPVDRAASTGDCTILHLVLGPLDLNLLGLKVHLDQVVLDITAQSGPGNLLGNLLCAIAHLLDGNGNALGRLANLLNQLLGALGL